MMQNAMPLSRAQEDDYEQMVLGLIRGGIWLVVSLIFFWIKSLLQASLSSSSSSANLPLILSIIVPWLLLLVSVFYFAKSIWHVIHAKKIPFIVVKCPYCDTPLRFTGQPLEGFDCEQCHRHVYYENGFMLPLQVVKCPGCGAEQRVSIHARTCTCESCNRLINLEKKAEEEAAAASGEMMSLKYDVILLNPGTNRQDVVQYLQSVMGCTQKDVHDQISSLPCPVVTDLFQRKAEVISKKLKELGAESKVEKASGKIKSSM
jgi:ribosomal protein L7/L12